jgi:hypothetical protein
MRIARTIVTYPPDHTLALARALRVFDIIAARPDIPDEEVVARLIEEGVDPVDAELLVGFVPCAMSYPVVKRMGATDLPSHYMVRKQSGRTVLLPLEAEHYFTAALAWAEELLNMDLAARPVSLEAFSAVVHRSPVLDAAERLLESNGPDALHGAVSIPLVVCGITAEQIEASRRGHSRESRWWQFWRS